MYECTVQWKLSIDKHAETINGEQAPIDCKLPLPIPILICISLDRDASTFGLEGGGRR